MTNCPCCSYPILRHVRAHKTVWFCRHCWQEVPCFFSGEACSLSSSFSFVTKSRQLVPV